MPRVRFFFSKDDFWVGLAWDPYHRNLFIAPFPCCILKVEMEQSGEEPTEQCELHRDFVSIESEPKEVYRIFQEEGNINGSSGYNA